jgi:hypothetical protein
MSTGSATAGERSTRAPAIAAIAVGALLLLLMVDPAVGALAALLAVATFAHHARMVWLAACAGAWALVLLAVLVFPGPYDSYAGRAVIPVLAGYALCFLGGWALGRRLSGRPGSVVADRRRPRLSWPPEKRLRWYLAGLLLVAVAAAVLRFHHTPPPLFAANPDAAREVLRQRANMPTGLLSEAWTLGTGVSLLRALTGSGRVRWWYAAATAVFAFGAALGASKNDVLVGIVPAVVAALSVQRPASGPRRAVRTRVILAVGLVAVAAAVFLGGQRTLAGTGAFEDQFRARYGGNPVTASVASLDLSLSASAETFGRLWVQHGSLPPRWGAYTLEFLGHHAEPLIGKTDLYGITGQLSSPYYMNTATFVAIPLLDYGPIGAAAFLLVLGVFVGIGDRRLEYATGPAGQLGRGFLVYFAVFGIYELYPALYPTWLALVPGLWVLHRLGRPVAEPEAAS